MEDRTNHRVPIVAVLTLGLLAAAHPSKADEHFTWPTDIVVDTNPDAVVVEAGTGGTLPGTEGSQAASGSGCHAEAITHIGLSLYEDFWNKAPNVYPFMLWCNGEAAGLVWLTVGGDESSQTSALSPQEIAMSLRERIPMPQVTIGINPQRGLVGVESWFWVEGYDGSPIVESTDAFRRQVEVEARVKRYEWRFGDGGGLVSRRPGSPYPERSEIRYTYERSSRGHPNGYEVEVGFVFSVRYRVGGGGWIDLPGIERIAQVFYPVRESQAVIHQ
jgi:hypothetical protein